MTANKNVQPTIEPDFDAILQHLELLFGRALKGLIEIGWTNSDTHKLQCRAFRCRRSGQGGGKSNSEKQARAPSD